MLGSSHVACAGTEQTLLGASACLLAFPSSLPQVLEQPGSPSGPRDQGSDSAWVHWASRLSELTPMSFCPSEPILPRPQALGLLCCTCLCQSLLVSAKAWEQRPPCSGSALDGEARGLFPVQASEVGAAAPGILPPVLRPGVLVWAFTAPWWLSQGGRL